jgi:hypothetical protein
MDDFIYRTEPFNPDNYPFLGTFKTAAEFLDFNNRVDRVRLRIGGMIPGEDGDIDFDDDGDETNEAFHQTRLERHYGHLAFNHFVAALGRQEEYRYLQMLDFSGVIWTRIPGQEFNRPAFEHLFSQVLPVHPTLEAIRFRPSIPTEYLRMFTSAIPATADATRLRDLVISTDGIPTPFNADSAHVIAAMIRRNGPISRIILRGILSTAGCAVVSQAMTVNTNVRNMQITVRSADNDTLQGLAASQTLQTLSVLHTERPAPQFMEQFARGLRTNTTLQLLHFLFRHEVPAQFWQPLVETLESHNYILRIVRTGKQVDYTMADLLQRNSFIRPVINDLQARDFRVGRSELPFYLERIQPFTSLVYRLLRHENREHLLQE